ncbi:hypothetical protein LMIY3S_05771 [Labrys miyagiensis]
MESTEFDLEATLNYLRSGGLKETKAYAELAHTCGEQKVAMNLDLLIALCLLAQQGLSQRPALLN